MLCTRLSVISTICFLIFLISTVSVSAAPQPQPSEIFGPTEDWLCPQADGAGYAITGMHQDDTTFTCEYGESYGIIQDCTYIKTEGYLWSWDNEDYCPDNAIPALRRRRAQKETNFTAMKRKAEKRAAQPRASVPDFMATRRMLRRQPSTSRPA